MKQVVLRSKMYQNRRAQILVSPRPQLEILKLAVAQPQKVDIGNVQTYD